MAKELAISIGHHTLGDAMKPHSLLKIEVGNMRSIIGGMAWDEVCHFRKSIYHHHNGFFVSLGPREPRNEV